MEFNHRLLSEGEAGVIWRATMLQTLGKKLESLDLGSAAAAELQELYQRVCEESMALDEMWETQRSSDLPQEWWQDGHLDQEAAERHNENGRAAMAADSATTALEQFSQAVRCWPAAAAYHNNRAAAALKAGRPDLAAASAEAALTRDPGNLGAALRLGKARLSLRQGEGCLAAFERAAELCDEADSRATDSAAKRARHRAILTRGLAAARALCKQQTAARAADAVAAARGARPGMGLDAGFPLPGMGDETHVNDTPPLGDDTRPAEALHAAQEIAAATPRLHAAQAALAEACIACGRWDDAAMATSRMLPGVDRTYLEAEIAWRRGKVEAAIKLLLSQQAAQESNGSRRYNGMKEEDVAGVTPLPSLGDGSVDGLAGKPGSRPAQGPSKEPAQVQVHSQVHSDRRQENGVERVGSPSPVPSTLPLPPRLHAPASKPGKCETLLAFLNPLAAVMAAAERAEDSAEAVEKLTLALEHLHGARAAGLRAVLLARRSAINLEGGRVESALMDAGAAVTMEPDNPLAVAARARALGAAKRHTEAFLLWRRLARLAPGTPGLGEETRRAAARCVPQQNRGANGACEADDADRTFAGVGLPVDALRTLDLDTDEGVTPAVVRAAYRRQAARWHPDRWRGEDCTAEQRRVAEEEFRKVQTAYERLLELMS